MNETIIRVLCFHCFRAKLLQFTNNCLLKTMMRWNMCERFERRTEYEKEKGESTLFFIRNIKLSHLILSCSYFQNFLDTSLF